MENGADSGFEIGAWRIENGEWSGVSAVRRVEREVEWKVVKRNLEHEEWSIFVMRSTYYVVRHASRLR